MTAELGAFDQLREIAAVVRREEHERQGREMLIRFLDAHGGGKSERAIVDALCARLGLYPYMSPSAQDLGTWEAFAIELHSPPELEDSGFTFHAEQQHVYERLMDGESIILSAPTSFGKSVIVDALIASGKWSNLALIVPTIALIDETRRRLVRFRSDYKIVTHPSEQFDAKNVLVMTQERFMEVEKLPEIDFFMIDEFYKLGAGAKNDSRRTLLNLAWNRLRASKAQYYLIGPNIDGLDERLPGDLREHLIRTDFSPVAVDVDDRSAVTDQRADLVALVRDELEGSTLIFTGSPQKAAGLGELLTEAVSVSPDGFSGQVAAWIGANFDPDWKVARSLAGGVAIHTGPLPRGLQRVMVRLFNEGLVQLMVCTSTLIEGVNTAARNVIIFEKKIDGQLIDFFTFSNIRGRAGRMFRHYVGHVITYMAPPEAVETVVDIPIESQSDLATPADLIQIEQGDLSVESMGRLDQIYEQRVLSLETIRRNQGFDPDLQIQAAERMYRLSRPESLRLSWSGAPDKSSARATLEFAFDSLLASSQRRGMNFNILWGRLQNARVHAGDIHTQVDQQMTYARAGQTRSDVVDDVFRFHRNWMGFLIPSMLRALQAIQNEVLASVRGFPRASYEYMLREVEGLYLPPGVADLEDYGVPVPLALRLIELGMGGSNVAERLDSLVAMSSDARTMARLSAVEQWILEDVVLGVVGELR